MGAQLSSVKRVDSSNAPRSDSASSGDEAPSTPVRRLPSLRYLKRRRNSVSAESSKLRGSAKLPSIPKTEAVAIRIRTVIQDISFFKELDVSERERLVEAMAERRVVAGEVVIKEGEQGDFFYAIDSGRFVASKNEEVKFVYDGSGSFGELALLYNSSRAATVTAETEGVLWALDRRSFRTLVVGAMEQRRERHEAVLKRTALFKDLSEQQLAAIADCLAPQSFPENAVIIRQGDPITSSSKFYIVEDGQVECFRAGLEGVRKTTRFIGPNDVFGEVSLLTNVPRQADCVATTPVTCLAMPRDAFERLMGPCEAILSKQIAEYKAMNEEQRRNTGP